MGQIFSINFKSIFKNILDNLTPTYSLVTSLISIWFLFEELIIIKTYQCFTVARATVYSKCFHYGLHCFAL